MKRIYVNYFILFFLIVVYKYYLVNSKIDNIFIENSLIKQENIYLKEQMIDLYNISLEDTYNYSLSYVMYKESYNVDTFYIKGGNDKNYKINNLVINDDGVVGIITKVYKDYSKCINIYSKNNMILKINDTYGTVNGMIDNLICINNITDINNISLNDRVYTSTYGDVLTNLYVGYVYKILDDKVLIKSGVDFNNIHYVYVVGNI